MSAVDVADFDDDELDDEETGETPAPARSASWGVAVLVIGLVLAIYLEVALAIDSRVLGAVPDLALIVIVAIALRYGSTWGALAGFAAGVLLDVAVQTPLGASSLVLTPIGWAAGAWGERRRVVSLGMAVTVLLAATLLAMAGDVIVTIAIEGQDVAWGTFVVHAIAELAFTLLLGIALLPVLRRVAGVPARSRA